jgi:DNA-binding transcriptional LysR family regulator
MMLQLSQPALSRSIQGIEDEVGAKLFLRSATGVAPTDIGRLLILRTRQVVQMAEAIDRDVGSDLTLQAGQVVVGSGPFPVATSLGTAVGQFINLYRKTGVRLEVANWDDLLPRLRARELDFFVAEISTLAQEHDLDIEPMVEHPVFFVGRTVHPLAGRSSNASMDILAYPIVSPSRLPPRLLAHMVQAQRMTLDRSQDISSFPSLECQDLSTVKRIVQNSDAVTATTLPAIATELMHHQLTLLATEPWLCTRYGLVRLKDSTLSSAAARLREMFIEAERALAVEEGRLVAQWTGSLLQPDAASADELAAANL